MEADAGQGRMTKRGEQVSGLKYRPDGALGGVIHTTLGKMMDMWGADGRSLTRMPGFDLVADWPDADPLPDADGWVKHTPGPCPVAEETEVQVRGPELHSEWKNVASYFSPSKYSPSDWWKDGTITHYRIVRPAPSGPVVEETGPVRMITKPEFVLGLHGIVGVTGTELPHTVRLGIEDGYYGPSEIRKAIRTLDQIASALEILA